MEAGVAKFQAIVPFKVPAVPALGNYDRSVALSRGVLRSDHGICSLEAKNDLDAVAAWLTNYRDSPQTLRAYEKEILRLLLWSVIVQRKPLTSLKSEDFMAYQAFVKAPPAGWCIPVRETIEDEHGVKHVIFPRPLRGSREWRPFHGPLSAKASNYIHVIASSFFQWLREANYISLNPLKSVKQATAQVRREAMKIAIRDRHLTPADWEYVLESLDLGPRTTDREIAHYERRRFILSLVYNLAARRAEVVSFDEESIFTHSKGKWWIDINGKGSDIGRLPLDNDLLAALRRYRTHLGLPPMPVPGEGVRMVMSIAGTSPISGKETIYKETKTVFLLAATRARKAGNKELGKRLSTVSTHWLRHTRLTHLADDAMTLPGLKRLARHRNVETTSLYLDTDDVDFHDTVNKHTPPRKSHTDVATISVIKAKRKKKAA